MVEVGVVLKSEIYLPGIREMTSIRQRFLCNFLEEICSQSVLLIFSFILFCRRINEFNLAANNMMKPYKKNKVDLLDLFGLKFFISF